MKAVATKPLAVATVIALVGGCGGPSTTQRRAVQAYRAGPLEQVIQAVGSLIVEQLKPALADLSTGRVRPAVFRAEAAAWAATIRQSQRGFQACPPPPPLRPAARLYDLALVQYQRAVLSFAAAAAEPKARLRSALNRADLLAEQADTTWNAADRLLRDQLRRFAIPTTPPLLGPSPAVGC